MDLFEYTKQKDFIRSGFVASVAVPRPVPEPLTYYIPESLIDKIKIGSMVEVPFKKGRSGGFVVAINKIEATAFEIKPIYAVSFEETIFTACDLEFYKWIADYYQIPLGEVFAAAFGARCFSAHRRVTLSRPECNVPIRRKAPGTYLLTSGQTAATKAICDSIDSGTYQSFLLYGVTGSGKTEVYLNATHHCVRQGKSALILVPEISLTPQLRNRFEERFGSEVAILHSCLTPKARREYWWDVLREKKKIVLGARSAIFAPLKNIGLIVVDEEHDPSYKQEARLHYNARDLALVRSKLLNAVTIMGSATPSLESYHAALNGKHVLLELKNRPQKRPMPDIEVVDMKTEFGNLFSESLILNLITALENGDQAMLFVNRKGYSNFLLCSDCGHVPECLNCSVSLTYYMKKNMLCCHYCGYEDRVPKACPQCSSLNFKFMGIGTELAEVELKKLFVKHGITANVQRLDAQTAPNMKKIEAILDDFRNQKTDVLVGTQMLAKGHDFPNVTFIGIILADINLHLPDFRAGERTFQLLAQVSGRAGRSDKPGKVILQTFMPDHYIIQSAKEQDYLKFYEHEIKERKTCSYPPFSRLAHLEFRHPTEKTASDAALQTATFIEQLIKRNQTTVEYLGPAPASIAKIANKYRWQILLKSEKFSDLNAVIKTLRKDGVRLIDVDPVNTL